MGDATALLAGDMPDVGAAKWIALGGGLVAGGTALVVIARVARKALARAIVAAGGESAPSTTSAS